MTAVDPPLTPPAPPVRRLIETLGRFDDGIVVARGDGWSVNLCGRVLFGRDGADPDAVRLADCDCHVHVDWRRAVTFTIEDEDVGYGAEPAAVLQDAGGAPVLRIFYPPRLREEIRGALTGPGGAGLTGPARPSEDADESDPPDPPVLASVPARRVAVVHTSGQPLLSGPARIRQFHLLARLGLDIRELVPAGPAPHGYAQADAVSRAETLAAAVTDPAVPCVWAAQGGYGATELVPHLRRLLPENVPETTFVGFSDSSFLGVWLASHYPGIRYVHATHALDPLALRGRRDDVARLVTLLHGGIPATVSGTARAVTDPGPTPIRGPVVPVNLSMAACLPGAVDSLPEGCVLLLEDVDDDLRRLLRCVDVLVTSGLSEPVRAVVLGQLTACRDEAGAPLDPARLGPLIGARTGRPVFCWPEFGHGRARTPLVYGDVAHVGPPTDGGGHGVRIQRPDGP